MTNSILLQDLTQQQLGELIDQKLRDRLEQLKTDLLEAETSNQLMTRAEACKFLKIDQSTLWAWTNKGKVQAYGIGNRRYYRRSELIEALVPLKK